MARIMYEETIRLYRTVVKKLVKSLGEDSEHYLTTTVYGPYDNKNVNRSYESRWPTRNVIECHVYKQELRPVFNLTNEGNLVGGLEWINYQVDEEVIDEMR